MWGKNTNGKPSDNFEFNKEFTRYWIYNIYIYICNVGTTTAGPDVMTNVLVQNYKMRERKNMLLIIKALLKGP